MIDKSNEIFNIVATDLRAAVPEIKVIGEFVYSPTVFPTVTIDEISNIPVYLDSASQSKYAQVVYRVQVFSNKRDGKRAEARDIYKKVDDLMQQMGFFATTYSSTPTIYNAEIYSITATYQAVIDENGTVYRG